MDKEELLKKIKAGDYGKDRSILKYWKHSRDRANDSLASFEPTGHRAWTVWDPCIYIKLDPQETIHDQDFTNDDFVGFNFFACVFTDCKFGDRVGKAGIFETDFKRVVLKKCKFKTCTIRNSMFTMSTFKDQTSWEDTTFSFSAFRHVRIYENSFKNCKISFTELEHVYFWKCEIDKLKIEGTKKGRMESVIFQNSRIKDLDISEAVIESRVSFHNCTLINCNFGKFEKDIEFTKCEIIGGEND
jgi:uncharacterized protein YjbI with pentapeptide repeats